MQLNRIIMHRQFTVLRPRRSETFAQRGQIISYLLTYLLYAGNDIGMSCIQWRASNRQGRTPVGVA